MEGTGSAVLFPNGYSHSQELKLPLRPWVVRNQHPTSCLRLVHRMRKPPKRKINAKDTAWLQAQGRQSFSSLFEPCALSVLVYFTVQEFHFFFI